MKVVEEEELIIKCVLCPPNSANMERTREMAEKPENERQMRKWRTSLFPLSLAGNRSVPNYSNYSAHLCEIHLI